jgi:ABC-2 type transport system permease protein
MPKSNSSVQIQALIKKELQVYFNSPIAYIFVVVFLGFLFWWFFRNFFLVNQADLSSFFQILPWIYLFLIPALTMRLWSEEKRQGTIETLLTSSIPLYLTVISKFLASVIFLLITLVATLPLPLIISTLGKLDWGVVICGYLGALLIGSAYISVGLLISATGNNQIVSFIVSALICFILFVIAQPFVTYSLPTYVVPVINFISFGSHYDSIIRGVIDTRDLIYYLSFSILMLYINSYILVTKR